MTDVNEEFDLLAGLRDGPWLDSYDPPPMKWAVPGLVPEGLALLVGPPKAGKSWLTLDLCLAVARGGVALGNQPVEKGSVLYLALEDGDRRMKTRTQLVSGDEALPPEFRYVTSLPKGTSLIGFMAAYVDHYPDVRLIAVDTLGKIRPRGAPGQNRYDEDYRLLGTLQEFAQDHGVAVLVCHHTRKQASDDFVDDVSGTNGIAGSADVVMSLRRPRGQLDAVLHLTSRETEEREIGLTRFGPCWQMFDGPVIDANLSDRMAKAIAFVNEHPEGASPKQVEEALGEFGDVRRYLARAEESGLIRKLARGLYTPVPSVPSVPMDEVVSPIGTHGTDGTHPLTENEETP